MFVIYLECDRAGAGSKCSKTRKINKMIEEEMKLLFTDYITIYRKSKSIYRETTQISK